MSFVLLLSIAEVQMSTKRVAEVVQKDDRPLSRWCSPPPPPSPSPPPPSPSPPPRFVSLSLLGCALLSQHLLTSSSAKYFLLETDDNRSPAAENSNKAGSDYITMALKVDGEEPIILSPDDDIKHGKKPGRSKDKQCGGNSRHGAPCTTWVILSKCLVALPLKPGYNLNLNKTIKDGDIAQWKDLQKN